MPLNQESNEGEYKSSLPNGAKEFAVPLSFAPGFQLFEKTFRGKFIQ